MYEKIERIYYANKLMLQFANYWSKKVYDFPSELHMNLNLIKTTLVKWIFCLLE